MELEAAGRVEGAGVGPRAMTSAERADTYDKAEGEVFGWSGAAPNPPLFCAAMCELLPKLPTDPPEVYSAGGTPGKGSSGHMHVLR